ncbi:hypothetical protein M406DRAFT_358561 [Cryphonectria parasitica EP155]|uniref:Uncharacterized protein n=1 Tax=Cryphonectria parasitica (strain ATCC 38755 / EP155) TaxID=660469 RepID=A0A9P4XRG3_CRYP1|nr:uncharacterized protein M406DRAFT_358561 [Cryphonectria parasitica EP155]KAF3760239.1 hypothetical protein M406DRAFT_358561 [Cryphonectria parasitica EP155]
MDDFGFPLRRAGESGTFYYMNNYTPTISGFTPPLFILMYLAICCSSEKLGWRAERGLVW